MKQVSEFIVPKLDMTNTFYPLSQTNWYSSPKELHVATVDHHRRPSRNQMVATRQSSAAFAAHTPSSTGHAHL